MKSTRLFLAASTLLVLLPAAPVRSASGSIASCHGSWRLTFSPGVGATAQRSAFTSNGESATVTCIGQVRGHAVAGPGSLGEEGWIEGTAVAGSGASSISLTIPTSAGPEKVSFAVTITYGPGIGLKHGDPLLGPLTFVYHPTAGNGLTEPVTEIEFLTEFVLAS
jgi:hypothetical protein